ncbi:MAG: serine/threonine protein kinase [Myxococcales bacterium]|nr:serine/threonine protein kinase [Myxococcales bacterium]
MIGTVLGSYRVVSRIGAGGMGSVWLAEHQLLGSRAAIKVLLPEMSSNRRIVQRFFDEARAATRIQDPGIVTVLDFGWHEGAAYIVMEHMVGETVTDRLRRVARLGLVEGMRLAQQAGIAMAAAHAQGIVHRDLKPDNMFLVADPAIPGGERVKILDFGIAKLIDEDDPGRSRTKTGVIMGTPAFMSPEQCRGAGGVDHRTDIYALGCVLYMMLCGRPPFVYGAPGDLIVAHISQQAPRPSALVPGLPPEVDEVIERCLAKDPDARFQTMTELVRAAGAITGENVSIETIAPKRSTLREPPSQPEPAGATLATYTPPHPAVTTLGLVTGQQTDGTASHPATRKPYRGWIIVLAMAVLVVGGVAFVLTRERGEPATATPGTQPPPPPPPAIDAAIATPPPVVDGGVAAAPIDAPAPVPPKKKKPPRTGSGSGSTFDPYSER